MRLNINCQKDTAFMIAMLLLAVGMNVFAYVCNPLYKVIIIVVDLVLLKFSGYRFKMEKYHVALVLFILWAGMSLLWDDFDADIMAFPTFIYCLVTVIIIHHFLDRESRFIILIKCIILSAYSLGLSMIAYFGLEAMLSARVGNELVNTNRAGTIFAISLYFCIFLSYKEHKKCYLVIGVPLFLLVLISGSKTALVIAAVSIFVMISLKNGKHSYQIFRNVAIAVVLIIIGFLMIKKIPVLYNVIGARFIEFVETMIGKRQVLVGEHSTYMRMTLSKFGLRGILESPLWGHGLDSFRYFVGNPWPGRYSHMNYIELAFNLGIIGLLLYYYPFIAFVKYFKRIKHRLDNLSRAFLTGFMICYFLYGLMSIFFNELFEWIIVEMMCSYVVMKHKEFNSAMERNSTEHVNFANSFYKAEETVE